MEDSKESRIRAEFEAPQEDTRDVVVRLRDTPNWMRESFGHWKSCTLQYDRAPFDAADEIERLRAASASRSEILEALRFYGDALNYEESSVLSRNGFFATGPVPIEQDRGKRARALLAKYQGE